VCAGVQTEKMRHFKTESCTFFSGRGNEDHLRTCSFVHHRKALLVTRVELVTDGMSNVVLRRCGITRIIVWNVHVPSTEKKIMTQKIVLMGNLSGVSIM
jgi:hypothetical protein